MLINLTEYSKNYNTMLYNKYSTIKLIIVSSSSQTTFTQMYKNKKSKKYQPAAGDRPDLIQTGSVPSRGLIRQTNKNKLNEKCKNTKRNYLSDVPLAEHVNKTKNQQKCQPAAGDRPDLIQTEPVPSRGLARPKNKNKLNGKKKYSKRNYSSNVPLVEHVKLTKKHQKCQPAAGDRPDLIQTEPVPSRGLARPKNKNKLNGKKKISKANYLSNVPLVESVKQTKKQQKCQPAAGDRPDLIQTEPVPSSGLARQTNKNKLNEKTLNYKRNYLSNVSIAQSVKHTNQTCLQPAPSYSQISHFLSRKDRNKLIKSQNGNGTSRKSLTVIHWNMGSKYWQRKQVEAEAVTQQYNPDLLIISEANMLNELSDLEKNLPGYSLLLPLTVETQKVARLVMFVKEGVNVTLVKEYMDTEVTAIWVKCSGRGRKPVLVAGVYREHKFLFHGPETGSDRAQNSRWYKFVDSWKAASTNKDVLVIGDFNLDYERWAIPDNCHKKMVDKVKHDIETSGFQQLVHEITRTWPGQPDSIWTMCGSTTLRKLSKYRT